MDKDKNIHKELEEISPFLAKMKGKKEEIETPENYFHYLENSVMQQVQLEQNPVLQKKEIRTISFWSRFFSLRVITGLASVILLIVVGIYFNQTAIDTSGDSLQFADLTDAEILNYLTDNVETLDIYSLSDLDVDDSILDVIDLEEGEGDYLFEESSMDIFSDEIF